MHPTRTLTRLLVSSAVAAAAGLLITAGGLPAGDAAPAAAAVSPSGPAAAALKRFKELAGEWEGTNSQGHPVRFSYEVFGQGSTVLERMEIGGHEPALDMATLYHLDGEKLMLTHYCVAANQPRMASDGLTADGKEVWFEFVDATNLASPAAGHMHRARYRFEDDGSLTTLWTWRENGEDAGDEEIRLRRSAVAAS